MVGVEPVRVIGFVLLSRLGRHKAAELLYADGLAGRGVSDGLALAPLTCFIVVARAVRLILRSERLVASDCLAALAGRMACFDRVEGVVLSRSLAVRVVVIFGVLHICVAIVIKEFPWAWSDLGHQHLHFVRIIKQVVLGLLSGLSPVAL